MKAEHGSRCAWGPAVLALLLLAPAEALLAQAPSADEEPAWLKEARAREGKPIAPNQIRSADGLMKVTVPARLVGDVSLEDGTYSAELDFGAGATANCEVLAEATDGGALIRATAKLTFDTIETIQGKVTARAIEKTDAGAFGEQPFLATSWIYNALEEGEQRLGGVKQLYAEKNGRSIYCAHAELGYEASFRRVAQAFVDSLELPSSEPVPYFVEIMTARVGQQRVGFAVVRLVRDDEGDTRIASSSAMLLPQPDGMLSSEDSTEIQWVSADGALINGVSAASSNGELDTNLKLVQADSGGWTVNGSFNSKEIGVELQAAEPPGHYIQQARARRDWLRAATPDAAGIRGRAWISIDPSIFSEWRVESARPLDATRVALKESVGDIQFDSIVERSTGLTIEAQLNMGAQSIVFERAHVRGSF
jgi:hypothetical protein